jgi:hypothetical protein
MERSASPKETNEESQITRLIESDTCFACWNDVCQSIVTQRTTWWTVNKGCMLCSYFQRNSEPEYHIHSLGGSVSAPDADHTVSRVSGYGVNVAFSTSTNDGKAITGTKFCFPSHPGLTNRIFKLRRSSSMSAFQSACIVSRCLQQHRQVLRSVARSGTIWSQSSGKPGFRQPHSGFLTGL